MNISVIPLINMAGKVDLYSCCECKEAPARVHYVFAESQFNLCVACIFEMENKVGIALDQLLAEKEH